MRTLWAAACLGCLAAAQPNLKPQRFEAQCADREIQELGLDCSIEEPCKVYFEISGVEHSGRRLFLAGNFHTETYTIESVLLASEDEGATWTEPHPRIKGATLEQIQFADPESGWISGVFAGSIAKDPFFLRTADGGKTWQRQTIFEDTEYATIEHFWFESKSQGMMVLNRRGQGTARFHRMETTTGGENWILREAAPKPPPPKRQRAGMSLNPDWRVRTDSAAKAFRLERRNAGRWNPVALFSYDGGACKPAPPPPPPEEPKSAEPDKPNGPGSR